MDEAPLGAPPTAGLRGPGLDLAAELTFAKKLGRHFYRPQKGGSEVFQSLGLSHASNARHNVLDQEDLSSYILPKCRLIKLGPLAVQVQGGLSTKKKRV
jgi:hypothetical protein